MAKHTKIDPELSTLVLTRKEATDLISLLVGHLAQEPVKGNQSGACPELIVRSDAEKDHRLVVAVEPHSVLGTTDDDRPVTYTINGKPYAHPHSFYLHYEMLLKLLGYAPDRVLTVTWAKAGGTGGELTTRKSFLVTDGTHINVADTSNA